MAASSPQRSVLRFGAFELDPRAGELRKNRMRIKLPPQPVKVLTLLASRAGELVLREEVRRELWGEDTFVDVEQGLGACISRIRTALGDNARTPRYIETLPRRGYRFLVPVEGLPPPRKLMLAVLPFDNLSGNRQEDAGLWKRKVTCLFKDHVLLVDFRCPEQLEERSLCSLNRL